MIVFRIQKYEPCYTGMSNYLLDEVFLTYSVAKIFRNKNCKDEPKIGIAYHIIKQEIIE